MYTLAMICCRPQVSIDDGIRLTPTILDILGNPATEKLLGLNCPMTIPYADDPFAFDDDAATADAALDRIRQHECPAYMLRLRYQGWTKRFTDDFKANCPDQAQHVVPWDASIALGLADVAEYGGSADVRARTWLSIRLGGDGIPLNSMKFEAGLRECTTVVELVDALERRTALPWDVYVMWT